METIDYFIEQPQISFSCRQYPLEGYFWDILNNLNVFFNTNEQIEIGEGTLIHETAVVESPVIIGKNCSIGSHVHIRPYTIIGDNCSIGHGSEIKASIVCNGAKISSLAFVGDSIIGYHARVGSGVITANRNFDQQEITIKDVDGMKWNTKRTFLGCILGDNSRIGANATTQPGTMISQYCWIYPTTAVRGFIPENKRVFNEKPLCFTDNQRINLS